MRRFSTLVATMSILGIPLSALALAGTPSALLPQITFKGNPHGSVGEFHLYHDDVHVELRMKGAAEGKTPATVKAWEDITIDINGDGNWFRAHVGIRVFHGALYAKLLSVEGQWDGDISEIQSWTQKPWVKIELPESAMGQRSFAAGVAAGLQESGVDVSESDVRAFLDAIVDALFTLESTRYQGGAAYSLRLAPDYLRRTIATMQTSKLGTALGLDNRMMDLPSGQPVNLHIRVNTNTAGELLFFKWYAATEIDGAEFVTQGTSQWQALPVYVDVPKNTMSMEQWMEESGIREDGMHRWKIPLTKTEAVEPVQRDDTPMLDATPRAHRPRPMGRPSVRRAETVRMREGCTATPGTSFYLQQTRKGACDLPARSTYRVNQINRGQQMRGRTMPVRNYHWH